MVRACIGYIELRCFLKLSSSRGSPVTKITMKNIFKAAMIPNKRAQYLRKTRYRAASLPAIFWRRTSSTDLNNLSQP